MSCSASEVIVLICFIRVCISSPFRMYLLNNSFNLLLLFSFSDRGSVMKISQPRGFSHPCLHSEMEVYPVSVQCNFVLTTGVTFQAAMGIYIICTEWLKILQFHIRASTVGLFKSIFATLIALFNCCNEGRKLMHAKPTRWVSFFFKTIAFNLF